MLCFILLVLAYKGFGEIRRASTKLIAGIGAILIGFIAVAQKFEFSSYVERESSGIVEGQYLKELETVWFSFLAIIAIGVVLCIATKTKRRTNVSLVLCILVCLEVFANGLVCCVELGDDVIYSSYSSYNDYIGAFRPLADDILENDPSFYRFEKTSLRKTGDNMALRIRGLTNSTSTLNKSTIDFLNRMGYTAVSHWTQYQGGNPVSDSLLGLKYIIGKTTDESLTSYYDSTELDTINYDGVNYSAYLNPYALSIAYGVDDAVLDYEMSPGSSATSSSPMKRLNELLAVMSGEESVSTIALYDLKGKLLAEGKYYAEEGVFPIAIALSDDAEKLAINLAGIKEGELGSCITICDFGENGQNKIDNVTASFDYAGVLIPEIDFVSADTLVALGDDRILIFQGKNKLEVKEEIIFDHPITSVFRNLEYIGVVYGNEDEDNTSHIQVYSLNGRVVMENDTKLVYDRVEFLDNNEICFMNDNECEIFTKWKWLIKIKQQNNIKYFVQGLPWCPVAKTPRSQCRGPRFDPWSGN